MGSVIVILGENGGPGGANLLCKDEMRGREYSYPFDNFPFFLVKTFHLLTNKTTKRTSFKLDHFDSSFTKKSFILNFKFFFKIIF